MLCRCGQADKFQLPSGSEIGLNRPVAGSPLEPLEAAPLRKLPDGLRKHLALPTFGCRAFEVRDVLDACRSGLDGAERQPLGSANANNRPSPTDTLGSSQFPVLGQLLSRAS